MREYVLRLLLRHHPMSTRVLLLACVIVVLLLIYLGMLPIPLICMMKEKAISDKNIGDFEYANKSLMFVTAILVLATALAYGQKKLFEFGNHGLRFLYAKVQQQIVDWFRETHPGVAENQIAWADEQIAMDSRLYHLKIMGNPDHILAQNEMAREYAPEIKEFCKCVHFEITNYPAELLYGIHFEFESGELNETLCEFAIKLLEIERQCRGLQVDTKIPKKPSWVFLTRKVRLEGDFDKELPKTATHARHFVELVGHTFELMYGELIIKHYLESVRGKQA